MALRAGRRIDAPLLRLIYRKNSALHGRFAFIIPKAVDKRSAARNRIRRRAREWVRVQPRILAAPFDIAIFFDKKAAAAPRRALKENLETVFERLLA